MPPMRVGLFADRLPGEVHLRGIERQSVVLERQPDCVGLALHLHMNGLIGIVIKSMPDSVRHQLLKQHFEPVLDQAIE